MTNSLIVASNIIFVKGFKKNLIIDLQNDCWYHVDFVLEKNEDIENLDQETLEYMLSENMIFEIPHSLKKRFKPFNLSYSQPDKIENAIIDRNNESDYSLQKAIDFLNSKRNKHLQIRWFETCNLKDLDLILTLTEYSPCECIELILPFDVNITQIIARKEKYLKIDNIIVHSVPSGTDVSPYKTKSVFFTHEKITSSDNCGQISPFIFTAKQTHVLKAINYNTCLFNKIGIDVNGEVKNCPSLKQSFGNISEYSSKKTIKMDYSIGKIKKDEIEVCSDCEFRYVCSDCRAFTDSSQRKTARPSKCDYNPFIAKWRKESDFISLENSGVVSNETNFSINYEKISQINNDI